MSTAQKPIAAPRKGKVSTKPPSKAGTMEQRPAYKGLLIDKTRGKKGQLLARHVEGIHVVDRRKLHNQIKRGFLFSSITKLSKQLELSQKAVAELLSISTSTLNRRKNEGHLRTDESDRVARFERLKSAALVMMQGDDQASIQWLKTPLDIFAGESPLEHSVTELGARDVEDLIGRIEHGVFS